MMYVNKTHTHNKHSEKDNAGKLFHSLQAIKVRAIVLRVLYDCE